MNTRNAVETHHLTRRFGSYVAVDNLELRVPQRSIYGFLGPNGAGKTTTIRMLLGLLHPTEGDVFLNGERFTPRNRQLLRDIGALVEAPSLYPHLTAKENLEIARRVWNLPKSRPQETLAFVGLSSDANRPVRSYSLGMKQRLGLALAWLNRPKLLLLDEPANGLDPAGVRDLRELLVRLTCEHEATILLSSHILSEVEHIADHIGIIHRGHLLYQGELKDLFQPETIVQLKVDRHADACRFLKIGSWDVTAQNGGAISVRISHAEEAAFINKILVEQGVNVYSLGLKQDTLETSYLQLISQAEGTAA